MTTDERRVLVWRRTVLAGSETFIRNQLDAMSRWEPVLTGLELKESALSRPDDWAMVAPDSTAADLRRKWFTLARRSRKLSRWIDQSGASLIHAHFVSDAVDVLPIARRCDLPLVVTAHGFDVTSWHTEPGPLGVLRRRRLRAVMDQAHTLVAVSEFIKQRLIALGAPEEKVVVLPIGVPTAAPRPAPRLGAPEIVFVGRLVEKKGVRDLLTAVSLIDPALRPRVNIVGDGPLRHELQNLASELGIEAVFHGQADPAMVRDALAKASFFVAPSKTAASGDSEGFGMVFLEAALAELPIVAYRHGGVPEAVASGLNGLLVPEGSVEELSRAIRSLIESPEDAAAMGAAGRRRVLEEFDVADLTPRLEELYDRVAKG